MGWLSGWKKRVKLTADHTVIDSDLTDFPALLYISASSGKNNKDLTFVFDEVGANYKKIAVTTGDGVTQCYVEVEKWDAVNEKAWLWVRCPTLSSTTGTDYYLYYDNDQPDNTAYVGDPNSTPAENVWDTNFKLVTHMRDDPDTSHLRDSTSGNHDLTKRAAGHPSVTVNGKIDDAQDFEAADQDYALTPNLGITGDKVTVEAWVNPESFVGGEPWRAILRGGAQGVGEFDYGYELLVDPTGHPIAYIRTAGNVDHGLTSANTLPLGSWSYVALVYDGSYLRLYINGADTGEAISVTGNIDPQTGDLSISMNYANRHFDGIIDEVRVSDTSRNAAWIKASYHSGNDSLWTWGSEETLVVGKPPMTLMGV